MKPGLTSLLHVASNADPKVNIRLAADIDSGEYATYINIPTTNELDDPDEDCYGHYFKCEGARHLAHKFATDDFFQRLEEGI